MSSQDPRADDDRFEELLRYLRTSRGFDFTGYKRGSLRRRVSKRMSEVGVSTYGDYLDFLQVHPDEFARLFNTILINVTSFFRDAEHWEYVAREVLPAVAPLDATDPIRVWSAGCSSGEEAYTLAILLAEHLGHDAFVARVKIYGTDVDEDALVHARQAVYDDDALESVPARLREQYFRPLGTRFQFDLSLRRAVIFGRHDVIQDAPISRLDLLTCRNVLMYFNTETQSRILRHLHFALKPDGFLFLGKAEMLMAHGELFSPHDLEHRVFRKATDPHPEHTGIDIPRTTLREGHVARHVRLRDAAFAASPVAQLVIDLDGVVVLASSRMRTLFGISPRDVGRSFRDLELSYQPAELRSRIQQAYDERRPIHLHNVERMIRDQERQFFDVWITPLHDPENTPIGVVITFDEVTRYEQMRTRLQEANEELETAYEELQSSNEELETTNEELQSTVEELETTNEELQSSNEELETMNEELQSTNAEQHEINRLLSQQGEELNRANAYLDSILSSLSSGVVVVDADFTVRLWNERSFDLWGLRSDEVVGRSLLNLDVGLPVDELAEPLRAALDRGTDDQTVRLGAMTRRGHRVTCRVVVAPLKGAEDPGVVLLVDVPDTDRDGERDRP